MKVEIVTEEENTSKIDEIHENRTEPLQGVQSVLIEEIG